MLELVGVEAQPAGGGADDLRVNQCGLELVEQGAAGAAKHWAGASCGGEKPNKNLAVRMCCEVGSLGRESFFHGFTRHTPRTHVFAITGLWHWKPFQIY